MSHKKDHAHNQNRQNQNWYTKKRFHIAQVQLQRTEPRKGSQQMPRYRTEPPTTNI